MHCLCCASLWRPACVYDDDSEDDGDDGMDGGADEGGDGDGDADEKDDTAIMLRQRNAMRAIEIGHGTSGWARPVLRLCRATCPPDSACDLVRIPQTQRRELAGTT